MTTMGELVQFPIQPVPEPTGDPYLDEIELEIIRTGVHHLDGAPDYLRGLARARQIYLRTRAVPCPSDDPDLYVRSVLCALLRLPECVRGRLRHPAYGRRQVQGLLREEQP